MFDSDAEAAHWLSQFLKRHPNATTLEMLRAVADAVREECEGATHAWEQQADTHRADDEHEEDDD
jgi:hypothetical protein